ncbi:hypothetical protein ACR8AL_00620 [Clavibacter sepedonicus]|uniref:Uncharacterized protein n=1 Tax=Clavibacter sepedonicus TaxID=31964 RepID=B0RFF4_CLASE|nr:MULTISPECIES: hypothetical protein [Clavibacter]MBD5381051.1 hypothetical protein [Clavibacter sp.]OQJ49366.1 hypothetical protein B5P19_14810 [Clavibacter sepedonicus]OQJ54981.1 hypothetical protein B5P20_13390 [Clavibacter sepedonicus]UUK64781.1 hypothetical protein LRE50_10835 [Clavibacter sepedonicus]CAQ01013.1 hypothetical protein CMS0897 [Clavibacter sepedonicus]
MTSAGASGTGDDEGDRGRDQGDDPAVAAEVLEAVLEPGPRRPVRRAVRAIGAIALAVVGGDVGGLGREAQLVVRRIDTGREVLRTDAGDLDEADRLLQRVRLDLETRSVREFVADWRLVDAGPSSGSSTGATGG